MNGYKVRKVEVGLLFILLCIVLIMLFAAVMLVATAMGPAGTTQVFPDPTTIVGG